MQLLSRGSVLKKFFLEMDLFIGEEVAEDIGGGSPASVILTEHHR